MNQIISAVNEAHHHTRNMLPVLAMFSFRTKKPPGLRPICMTVSHLVTSNLNQRLCEPFLPLPIPSINLNQPNNFIVASPTNNCI
nr:hypothetical protein Iba_chr15eCG5660 [Ipomoea batatas]